MRWLCNLRAIKRIGDKTEVERATVTIEAATREEARSRATDRYTLPPYTAVQIDNVWEYR